MNFSKQCFLLFSLILCFQANLISRQYVDEGMYSAILTSDSELVTHLIKYRYDVNSLTPFGGTNLGMAVLLNEIEIVNILLENGADPNLYGDSRGGGLPLYTAVWKGNEKMVELLLEYGADPQYDPKDIDNSPISYAQKKFGYPSPDSECHPIVALLLKHIEEKNNIGLEH